MISAWWTLFAFIGGGCAGVLLIALMRVTAHAESRSSSAARSEAMTRDRVSVVAVLLAVI